MGVGYCSTVGVGCCSAVGVGFCSAEWCSIVAWGFESWCGGAVRNCQVGLKRRAFQSSVALCMKRILLGLG